ncbi:MAG: DUF3047 domain-containing protein, partial [Geopsychrobacter sp.]|nr:DUF3047 domain-containing protein [Geopsychrobacter sp.]
MKILLTFIFILHANLLCAEVIRLDFSQGPKGWDEKVFNGRTAYRFVKSEDHMVLAAESQGNASALIYWQDVDPQKYPRLRWRWKIERILEKGRVGTKPGDDYPARIYIVFDSWLPNYARSINYIWAS